MPYHLELGSDGHSFKGKAIVVNSQTGKHYSKSPIPLANAEAQMRILKSAEEKEDDPPKEKWIQKVVESPDFEKGAFTAEAKEHGMTTKAFMKTVLAHPEKYDTTTRKRAQFMKNIQRK